METRSGTRYGWLVGVLLLVNAPAPALGATAGDALMLLAKASTKRPGNAARPQTAAAAASLPADIGAVAGPAGQAGYVHYFVITGPDGDPETEVGIELEDGRIAWSFPDAGVFVGPFLTSGSFTIGSNRYDVEHLYGLRPFRDEVAMRAFRAALAVRVAPFLEEWTPYCAETGSGDRFCLSCLGFVLRVVFPGHTRAYPALPPDFKSARKELYSTEDLLLYLAGVPIDGPRIARARRIQALLVPAALREELTRISAALDDMPAAATPAKTRRGPAFRSRAAGQVPGTPHRAPGQRS